MFWTFNLYMISLGTWHTYVIQFGHDVDRGMTMGGARVMLAAGGMRGGHRAGHGADIR